MVARVAAVRAVATMLLILLLAASGAAADESPSAPPGTAVVARVLDGQTVVLDTGDVARLAGILAPVEKAALEDLVLGQRVTLDYGAVSRDRHGRLLAQFHDATGRWVQGALVDAGLARVYTTRDSRAPAAALLALERGAREAGRGAWGDGRFVVLAPGTDLPRHAFSLVEGIVRDVAVVRGRTYLNFGADWHSDFTVTIGPKDATLFVEAGLDPAALEGRRVRIRGWIGERNGPMIEATHPEQIEVLEP